MVSLIIAHTDDMQFCKNENRLSYLCSITLLSIKCRTALARTSSKISNHSSCLLVIRNRLSMYTAATDIASHKFSFAVLVGSNRNLFLDMYNLL